MPKTLPAAEKLLRKWLLHPLAPCVVPRPDRDTQQFQRRITTDKRREMQSAHANATGLDRSAPWLTASDV
jgi:hypothetical protein